MQKRFWILMFVHMLVLNGCAPVAVVGVGAVAGKAAMDERGMGGSLSDIELKTKIATALYKKDSEMFRHITVSVREGRALVAGSVHSEATRQDALQVVRSVPGVKEVIDQIIVSSREGTVKDMSRDTWITTKLKSQMLMDKKIASRNYNIKTEGAVVYIMGVAQTLEELKRVTDLASNIPGVQKVVSHARVKAAAQAG